MGLYLQERPRARLTYQPGARQQEGLKERKRGGGVVSICLGKEVFLLCLYLLWGTHRDCAFPSSR